MCEIFGFNSSERTDVKELLQEFYKHSEQHPHGWGLAVKHHSDITIEKEPLKASESQYLKSRLFAGVKSDMIMAHIRYATIGNIDYVNCHPYSKRDESGRRWVLIHNGTIFNGEKLSKYIYQQQGETDSERVLYYIVEENNKRIELFGRALTNEERFAILDDIVCELSVDNKLNIILWDGDYLYAHSNLKGTLYYTKRENSVCIATKPLREWGWESFPHTQLIAFQNGKLIRNGTIHNREYIETEENLKFLYQIFSNL